MSRFPDVHPDHIDPETGRPYANYSSDSLDTSAHDAEMRVEDEDGAAWSYRLEAHQGGQAYSLFDPSGDRSAVGLTRQDAAAICAAMNGAAT